ncbi:MAG: hypothetical protein LUD78_10860 [Clostridiales bacterium]|nr:hypothetical protein [Clostridiales bacterium]
MKKYNDFLCEVFLFAICAALFLWLVHSNFFDSTTLKSNILQGLITFLPLFAYQLKKRFSQRGALGFGTHICIAISISITFMK